MKLDRTEIAVLVGFVLLILTLNAWWTVKQEGRLMKARFEAQDASLVDGRVVLPDAPDGGRR